MELVTHLDREIHFLEQAVNATSNESSQSSPNRMLLLETLGLSLASRWKKRGRVADLDQAIRCMQQVISAAPNHPNKIEQLQFVGVALHGKYKITGEVNIATQAIQYLTLVVDATDLDNDPDRVNRFRNLAVALRDRGRGTGHISDFDQAILWYQKVVDAVTDDDPDYMRRLESVGVVLIDRYRRAGNLDDLNEAIRLFQRVADADLNHPSQAGRLENLGCSLHDRYTRLLDPVDLDRAIRHLRQAASVVELDQPARFESLGTALRSLYLRTELVPDIDEAIKSLQKAIDGTPEDHPNLAKRSESLAIGLNERYKRTRDPNDINRAIDYLQRAVGIRPAHAGHVHSLGVAKYDRYLTINTTIDLDQAIQHFKQAIRLTPSDSPDLGTRLESLAGGLRSRFQRVDSIVDLDQAVEYLRQAVDVTPDNYSDRRAKRLQGLGAGLRERYQRTGQLSDLDEAIQHVRKALGITAEDLPRHARLQHSLGGGIHDWYRRTRHIDDLDQAIHYLQKAVDTTPDDHPDRIRQFDRLGGGFLDRYRVQNKVADLEHSVQYLQKAVSTTVDEHDPYRATRLENLGVALATRFARMKRRKDLDQAVQHFQHAVDATSSGHPLLAGRLQSLGVGLGDRYRAAHQAVDLTRAVQYLQQAVSETMTNHPDQAERRQCLGIALYLQYLETKDTINLRKSTDILKLSLSDHLGLPMTRVESGIRAVQNLVIEQKWEEGARLLEDILQLLPEVTTPTHSRSDLQHSLRELSGLASSAASILLKAKRSPVAALQALENSRGVIASLMMDARSDASTLKDQHPQLESRYTKCREQLASLNTRSDGRASELPREYEITRVTERQQFSETLRNLQREIRTHPGFERFLLPPTEQEFQDLAQDGPLVCFNVSSISSEVFLVTTTDIQVLSLSCLTEPDVKRRLTVFSSQGDRGRRDMTLDESDSEEEAKKPVMNSGLSLAGELDSLWKHAVRPVLDRLGLLAAGHDISHQLPRIWWVGGGSMALMPLHAAGSHGLRTTENTLSHVISSYVPTFKALQFVQSKPVFSIKSAKSQHEILIVSMPQTPGKGPRGNIDSTREAEAIQKQSRSWATTTVLDRPSSKSVMDALASCTVAHLACHASADPVEPAQSHLLLGRDRLEKLTLADMDAVNLDRAQIAYLSACSTAQLRVQDLADESIHLASAFQLVGFTHVVGTMWSAYDDAAVQITGKFYENLKLYDDDRESGRGLVARALHHAVLHFRDQLHTTVPTAASSNLAIAKWAPFIHLGC